MKKKIWLWILIPLLLIPVGAYLLLFQVNSFSVVIRLLGPEEMTIPAGAVYADPGAEVKLVGDIFFKEGLDMDVEYSLHDLPDTAVPGAYTVIYRSPGTHGMKGYAERRVIVLDTEAPRITLKSSAESVTVHGETYQEEGFSAWDNADGDITHRVVREEKDGFVHYTVSDSSGNRTSVSRKISYVDITPPALTLLGEATTYLTAGEDYAEPGWTARDNLDGDLSDWVKTEGTVDKYLAGSYQLTYTVRDNSGNCAEVIRTVVVQPKELPETVYPEGKVIYLTFDDGPGPYTDELLEILAAYDAKATFFVVNTKYLDLVKDMVDQGHSVGIHSVNHDYGEIYASPEAFFNDLLTMQQIIYEKSGVMTYLMRFPGGSSNTVSRFTPGIMTYLTQAVEDNGFQYFDWNVDSDDAGRARDRDDVFENVVNGVEARRISVVLQHDIKGFSVDAVEKILRWGTARGYQFLALDMTSPTAHHGVNN